MQCDINKEARKTSALSSSKIDKYEYLTREEILASSPIGQALEKQTEKKNGALNSLSVSDETDELKQTQSIFRKTK